MDISFRESETKENLMRAFAGESQARNRYSIAAKVCERQNLQAIGQVFLFTAEQERGHAERFYELLKDLSGDTIQISGGYPVDQSEDIAKLLEMARHNEMEEYEDVYQSFGDKAKAEGFFEAASAFYQIAEIEKIHARRFGRLKELLDTNTYFEQSPSGVWMCMNCGHIQKGSVLPPVCPTCHYGKGYFIPAELAPYLELGLIGE